LFKYNEQQVENFVCQKVGNRIPNRTFFGRRKERQQKKDRCGGRKEKRESGKEERKDLQKIQAREKCSNAVKDQLRSINLTSF
jgi:hypothetical protein